MNLSDFFAMGGYAQYVWGAYGAALVVLVGNIWSALRRDRTVRKELRNLEELRRSDQP